MVRDGTTQQRTQHTGNGKNGRDDGDVGRVLGRWDHERCHDGDEGVDARGADALDGPEDDQLQHGIGDAAGDGEDAEEGHGKDDEEFCTDDVA